MLYVKIMSFEDMPDTDPNKCFSIIPVENNQTMDFDKNLTGGTDRDYARYVLRVSSPDGSEELHELHGNAYVMNERGVTIATHAC